MKKSFCRNMIKLTSIKEKRHWNFPSQFFSGWDESQSVGNVPYVSGKCVAELNLSYFLTEAFDLGRLRSWRYCVIKALAAEPRSKKRNGDEAFFWRPRQISLDWYSGSAAKSQSTSTQYRQLRRLFDRGCCAEPLSWNYVLITLSRCKFHFENRIFRCFLSWPPSTSMPLWNSPQCFLFFFYVI